MPVDIFATKGTEYLLTIVYFALLIVLVRYLAPRAQPARRPARRPGAAPWFALRGDYHFHPGHGWAADGEGDTVTVGLDDFAAQYVGRPDDFALPKVGERLRQGGPGWRVAAGDRSLAMVAPVDGEVVAVNPDVIASPGLAADDPYGKGWLCKVRAPAREASLKNLLTGEMATLWMGHTADRLRRLTAEQIGVMMTDGGAPVRGFGRELGPDEWRAVSREFFLTE